MKLTQQLKEEMAGLIEEVQEVATGVSGCWDEYNGEECYYVSGTYSGTFQNVAVFVPSVGGAEWLV